MTTRGSIYDRWVRNCFKSTNLLVLDSTTSSTLALKDRRADTFMFDDALLLGIAANDSAAEADDAEVPEPPVGDRDQARARRT